MPALRRKEDLTRIAKTNLIYAEVLRLSRELREEGYTYQEIAERLNAKGLRTRKGKPWYGTIVHDLLESRR